MKDFNSLKVGKLTFEFLFFCVPIASRSYLHNCFWQFIQTFIWCCFSTGFKSVLNFTLSPFLPYIITHPMFFPPHFFLTLSTTNISFSPSSPFLMSSSIWSSTLLFVSLTSMKENHLSSPCASWRVRDQAKCQCSGFFPSSFLHMRCLWFRATASIYKGRCMAAEYISSVNGPVSLLLWLT